MRRVRIIPNNPDSTPRCPKCKRKLRGTAIFSEGVWIRDEWKCNYRGGCSFIDYHRRDYYKYPMDDHFSYVLRKRGE